jgi:hypothetical protein
MKPGVEAALHVSLPDRFSDGHESMIGRDAPRTAKVSQLRSTQQKKQRATPNNTKSKH